MSNLVESYRTMKPSRKRHSEAYNNQWKRSKPETSKVILPIFEPSGLLELESHGKDGVLLKHIEPSDAQSPNGFWNQYDVPIKNRRIFQAVVYKKGEKLPINEYDLETKSSLIIGRALGRSLDEQELDDQGRERKEVVVADIPIPEETCSKQHCVIQFRDVKGKLTAYVMDLDSSNGSALNGVTLPRARYVELRSGDAIGLSENNDSNYEVIFLAV